MECYVVSPPCVFGYIAFSGTTGMRGTGRAGRMCKQATATGSMSNHLDLVNKPQTWQRLLPSGEPALDGEGLSIFDLLIWVGQEHYPYCPDFLEECLPPDELIATTRGLVPIREVRESDMVLTHLGHLRAV